MRRTKIVCTIGPATESADTLRQLIAAGADVLRLNFSHGTPAAHQMIAQRIRDVATELGKPVAILQDLPGPKIRLGTFPDGPIQLHADDRFTLTTANVPGTQQSVSVNYARLADEVQPGQTLLLADGTVELRIVSVVPPAIHCQVIVGGCLSSRKGVTVPRGALSLDAFTAQDRAYLRLGIEMGVDLAALSFVRAPADVAAARQVVQAHHTDLPLMVKIEKPEALDVLDALLATADAVMVARGDLGVEIPLAEVPLVQKDIIRQAIQAAKPVVTATQMLRSMVENPRPTRAEASDVANAVLDGSDAVMLSEESAVGAYPVEAVRILAQIAETVEKRFLAQARLIPDAPPAAMSTSAAIGHAACMLAREAGAAAIVCCTRTGRTARLVAKHRPVTPILAVSPHRVTVQRLSLTWGVRAVWAEECDSTDAMVHAAVEAAGGTGWLAPGDKLVLVGAAPSTPPGHSDFVRVVTVS